MLKFESMNPEIELAKSGELEIDNGIVVNEYRMASRSDIYTVGDNAFFPYRALGKTMRIENRDHALN